MHIAIISELSGSPDEGMRNWVRQAITGLSAAGHETVVVHLSGDARSAALRPSNLRTVRRVVRDAFIYVPYSGLTTASLFRLAALRGARPSTRSAVAILQADPSIRVPSRLLAGELGLFASRRLQDAHGEAVRRSVLMPPAIDTNRFRPSSRTRQELRLQLGFPVERPLVLHVGHIRPSRNLDPVVEIAMQQGIGATVVVVGSTATAPDRSILQTLDRAGVHVIRDFLPRIELLYQAADAYVFPVTDPQGSIEVPLTVLEAIACGTPVATTRFGGLPELLLPGEHLAYADEAGLPRAVYELLHSRPSGRPDTVQHLTLGQLGAAVAEAFSDSARERRAVRTRGSWGARPSIRSRTASPRQGVIMALCGIDGTGKSTQTELVVKWARHREMRAASLWCRWDPILGRPAIALLDRLSRGNAGASARGGESAPSRRRRLRRRILAIPVLRSAWLAVIAVDYGVQTALKVRRARRRHDLVVLDRYWHDVLVDLSVGGPLAQPPAVLTWLLPSPDLLVTLDLREETALRRKPDVPDLAYLRDRRRLYRELAQRQGARVIDASQPVEAVSAEILSAAEDALGLETNASQLRTAIGT